jgi:hypothetical protein
MFSLGCGSVLAVLLTAAWVALDGRSLRRERPQALAPAPVAQPEPVIDDALPRLLRHAEPADKIGAEIEQWLKEGGRG